MLKSTSSCPPYFSRIPSLPSPLQFLSLTFPIVYFFWCCLKLQDNCCRRSNQLSLQQVIETDRQAGVLGCQFPGPSKCKNNFGELQAIENHFGCSLGRRQELWWIFWKQRQKQAFLEPKAHLPPSSGDDSLNPHSSGESPSSTPSLVNGDNSSRAWTINSLGIYRAPTAYVGSQGWVKHTCYSVAQGRERDSHRNAKERTKDCRREEERERARGGQSKGALQKKWHLSGVLKND